ncbi:DEAD/DEAH box helicase domain-containing protein [Cardiosporidium cionae]|uniref:DEAD/DEAH box helicase domain-containing protein n=1 Tax=Cardiosporidium cionae TaxID=476202 RepID=A0ABQ7J7R7_9APIC|nr:DEAD/DEAH box helicase domain-containing protein [Cardiosporidium cionae]|eukprot:KAF8819993.1 DEAD/DEAH box helicase domain-containing protein [Cardiosporidium cionae]
MAHTVTTAVTSLSSEGNISPSSTFVKVNETAMPLSHLPSSARLHLPTPPTGLSSTLPPPISLFCDWEEVQQYTMELLDTLSCSLDERNVYITLKAIYLSLEEAMEHFKEREGVVPIPGFASTGLNITTEALDSGNENIWKKCIWEQLRHYSLWIDAQASHSEQEESLRMGSLPVSRSTLPILAADIAYFIPKIERERILTTLLSAYDQSSTVLSPSMLFQRLEASEVFSTLSLTAQMFVIRHFCTLCASPHQWLLLQKFLFNRFPHIFKSIWTLYMESEWPEASKNLEDTFFTTLTSIVSSFSEDTLRIQTIKICTFVRAIHETTLDEADITPTLLKLAETNSQPPLSTTSLEADEAPFQVDVQAIEALEREDLLNVLPPLLPLLSDYDTTNLTHRETLYLQDLCCLAFSRLEGFDFTPRLEGQQEIGRDVYTKETLASLSLDEITALFKEICHRAKSLAMHPPGSLLDIHDSGIDFTQGVAKEVKSKDNFKKFHPAALQASSGVMPPISRPGNASDSLSHALTASVASSLPHASPTLPPSISQYSASTLLDTITPPSPAILSTNASISKSLPPSSLTFDKLGFTASPSLLSGVAALLGKSARPTPVQARVMPLLLASKTVAFASEAGSGKTLTFLLPLFQRLKAAEIQYGFVRKRGHPRAIILLPSRELAKQVLGVVKTLGHFAKMASTLLVGGDVWARQATALQDPIDILIGTPSRILMHLKHGTIKTFEDLSVFVVDEVDTLLMQGFKDEISKLLQAISASSKSKHQTVQRIFSTATLTADVKALLAEFHFPEMETVEMPRLHKAIASVRHELVEVKGMDKLEVLGDVLRMHKTTSGKLMIFCNTVQSCRACEHYVRENGWDSRSYHSEMPQTNRDQNFEDFRDNTTVSTLVCTDLASRGLDIPNVNKIIMFDFPLNPIDFLHRAGRTGRMGKKGQVISLITKRDRVLALAIQKAIAKKLPLDSLSSKKIDYTDTGRLAYLSPTARSRDKPSQHKHSTRQPVKDTRRGGWTAPK